MMFQEDDYSDENLYEASYEQSGEFDTPCSHESSMNCASLGMSINGSVNQNNLISSDNAAPLAPINEDITNENVSDAGFSMDHEHNDMFFSCADWETQIKQSQSQDEESDEGVHYMTPRANKRQQKTLEKLFQSAPQPLIES
jgi:hypothetical protein